MLLPPVPVVVLPFSLAVGSGSGGGGVAGGGVVGLKIKATADRLLACICLAVVVDSEKQSFESMCQQRLAVGIQRDGRDGRDARE